MTGKDQSTMNKWNMGVILAIVLNFIATGYWGGDLSSRVASIEITLVEGDQENLRQWGRINENEDSVQLALSNQRTTTAILQRVEDSVDDMEVLLREYLDETRNRNN